MTHCLQLPAYLSAVMELLVEPDQVLAIRSRQDDPHLVTEVLIRWKGLPEFEATWESAAAIRQQFPDFNPQLLCYRGY